MCKFCEEGKEKLLPLDYANTDFGIMMDEENTIIISYDDSDYAVYHCKHCPECGRRLDDLNSELKTYFKTKEEANSYVVHNTIDKGFDRFFQESKYEKFDVNNTQLRFRKDKIRLQVTILNCEHWGSNKGDWFVDFYYSEITSADEFRYKYEEELENFKKK